MEEKEEKKGVVREKGQREEVAEREDMWEWLPMVSVGNRSACRSSGEGGRREEIAAMGSRREEKWERRVTGRKRELSRN